MNLLFLFIILFGGYILKLKEGYELNYSNGFVSLSKGENILFSKELTKETVKNIISSIIDILSEHDVQESTAKIESIIRMYLNMQEPPEIKEKQVTADEYNMEDIRLKVILISTSYEALKFFLEKIGFPKSFADKAMKSVQLAELTSIPNHDNISITFWIIMKDAFQDKSIIEGSDFIFIITDENNKDVNEVLDPHTLKIMKEHIVNFTYLYDAESETYNAFKISEDSDILQQISNIIKNIH